VNGLVTAASNRKPLPLLHNTDNGLKTITDVDGKFTLNTKNISLYRFLHRFIKTTITISPSKMFIT
jgi:hypothetical protein